MRGHRAVSLSGIGLLAALLIAPSISGSSLTFAGPGQPAAMPGSTLVSGSVPLDEVRTPNSSAGVAPGSLPATWIGGHAVPRRSGSPFPSPAGFAPAATSTPCVSEPLPVGITDYGGTSATNLSPYTTSRFLATAQIASWNQADSVGGNSSTLQLNVVVEMTSGSRIAEYWIQDVFFVNTTADDLEVVDNVWNFSTYGAGPLDSSSIQGNGSIYNFNGVGAYVDTGPSYATPKLPANLSVEVVASRLNGLTHVGFEYDIGSGWSTYDNVTFPWTRGWDLLGFAVNGSSTNLAGLYNDAEWIIGGPGDGSSVTDLQSNLTMSLEYFNGQNFRSVDSAFGYGSDTAETASDVALTFLTPGPPGTPSVRARAANGCLGLLWGPTDLGIGNVTTAVTNGTLTVDGVANPYFGSVVNLSLVPGDYRIAVMNGGTVVNRALLNLTAGAYEAIRVGADLSLEPEAGPAGSRVTATGQQFDPGTIVDIVWPTTDTTLCNVTVAPNGTFACSITVPVVRNGAYDILANDTTAANSSSIELFDVTTNLTVRAAASVPQTEVGGLVRLWSNATLGDPPYTLYSWNLGVGPLVNTTEPSILVNFTEPGAFTLTVTVFDRIGDTSEGRLRFVVLYPLEAGRPTTDVPSADVGQNLSFDAPVSGGSGGELYGWTGLPPGCRPDGALALCPLLTTAGHFSVSVAVTDSDGFASDSPPLAFTVYDDPIVTGIEELPRYVDAGQSPNFTAETSYGAGNLTYEWEAGSLDCPSLGATLLCPALAAGNYSLSVSVVDGDGVTSTAVNFSFEVYPDPSASIGISGNSTTLDVGEMVELRAEVAGGSGVANFSWNDLPIGCGAPGNVSSLSCRIQVEVPSVVRLVVADRSGLSVSAYLRLSVNPAVTVTWEHTPPGRLDAGMLLSAEGFASGGTGYYTYAWSDLPPGCTALDTPALGCVPTGGGNFSLRLSAVDADGENVSAPAVNVTIAAAPEIVAFVFDPAAPLEGRTLRLSAEPLGGTGGIEIQWSGLPPGCRSTNSSTLECTPSAAGSYTVKVEVSDALGQTNDSTVRLSVGWGILGVPAGFVLLPVSALVVAVVVFAWRQRRQGAIGRPRPRSLGPP